VLNICTLYCSKAAFLGLVKREWRETEGARERAQQYKPIPIGNFQLRVIYLYNMPKNAFKMPEKNVCVRHPHFENTTV